MRGGSLNTASSVSVRTRFFSFSFYLEAGWAWEFTKIQVHVVKKNTVCVSSVCGTSTQQLLQMRRWEGYVSSAVMFCAKVTCFFFFFREHYNEMDSCCIWSQKRFLTWYSGTSFFFSCVAIVHSCFGSYILFNLSIFLTWCSCCERNWSCYTMCFDTVCKMQGGRQ